MIAPRNETFFTLFAFKLFSAQAKQQSWREQLQTKQQQQQQQHKHK